MAEEMQEGSGSDHVNGSSSTETLAVDPLVAYIYKELITSICVDVSHKMHRMIKTGQVSPKDLLIPTRIELYPSLYDNTQAAKQALDLYATELPSKRARFMQTDPITNNDDDDVEEDFDKNDSDAYTEPADSEPAPATPAVMTLRHQASADIWGHPPKPGSENVECSVCNRQVSSVRFAPHLDKCMGIGTTSRAAAGGASTSSTRQSKF
jgi:hypothetical protein